MPANKNQHYVPQFYLRQFANHKGNFNIYNIRKEKTYYDVPFKGQCQRDYFYGNDLALEKKFSAMENDWSHTFNKLIYEKDLNQKDIINIKKFAIFQRTRTEAALEYGEESKRIQMIEFMKMTCANKRIPVSQAQIESLINKKMKDNEQKIISPVHFSEDFLSYTRDLNVVVLTYYTKDKLISSDVPVVSINKFLETNIGYANAGFISFFPISENKVVAIYDARMYPLNKDKLYVESTDETEVRLLNEYQLINAEKIIYGCYTDMNALHNANVASLRNLNRNRPAIQAIGSNEGKLFVYQPRLSIYHCELSFAALNRDARRIPTIGRDILPRNKDVEYVSRMEFREDILPDIEKKRGNKSVAKPKEIRRAIRRMSQFTYRYWAQPIPVQVLTK